MGGEWPQHVTQNQECVGCRRCAAEPTKKAHVAKFCCGQMLLCCRFCGRLRHCWASNVCSVFFQSAPPTTTSTSAVGKAANDVQQSRQIRLMLPNFVVARCCCAVAASYCGWHVEALLDKQSVQCL